MSDFVVVNDPRADVFRHVISFDAEADAVWFRFNSPADMFRLGGGIVPRSDSVTAFLLTQDFNGPTIPRLSEFQGAFGRTKLYRMNKNKTLRRKVEVEGLSAFLDGAPAYFGDEWKGYLSAVYNGSLGFLIGGGGNLESFIDGTLHTKSLSEFLSYVVDNCAFAGLFLEDHRVAWSLVLIGRALPCSITSVTNWIHETPDATLECVHAYGDRLASQYLLKKVLRCGEE